MSSQVDFKKEWEKTRNQLIKISQEAAKAAKKGEKELIKISQQSKLHIDSTAAGLRKEKLYYLIGKEVASAKEPSRISPKLAKLLAEYNKLNREQSALKRKIKSSARKK